MNELSSQVVDMGHLSEVGTQVAGVEHLEKAKWEGTCNLSNARALGLRDSKPISRVNNKEVVG